MLRKIIVNCIYMASWVYSMQIPELLEIHVRYNGDMHKMVPVGNATTVQCVKEFLGCALHTECRGIYAAGLQTGLLANESKIRFIELLYGPINLDIQPGRY